MIQSQGSPITPVHSNSTTASDPTAPWILSEEIDSGTKTPYAGGEKNFQNIAFFLLANQSIRWGSPINTIIF
jgi:hypothetical protein